MVNIKDILFSKLQPIVNVPVLTGFCEAALKVIHIIKHLYLSNQSYKHILLPLWVCSYLYKNKRYHFLVNGQTGKNYGKKPVSAFKIKIAPPITLTAPQ